MAMKKLLRPFPCTFRSFALSLLLAGAASIQAADSEKSWDIPADVSQWRFFSGDEFPGAKGAVSDGTSDSREIVVMEYDFSGGGEYVQIEAKETVPEEFTELRFEARSDREQSFVIRLIDDTDQTHQYALKYTNPSEWQALRVDFNERATDHFKGANDGVIHYPIRFIGLCVQISDENKTEPGKVEFSKIQLLK